LTIQVLEKAKELEPKDDGYQSRKRNSKNTELLTRYEGDGWSDEVLESVEKDMLRA